MSALAPRPLYYTFGNHMHWVDMQWLWGYAVLPGCTDDMLRFCAEAGVRGNVNFDGIGYEKMAAECPQALGRLRQAISDGDLEPVGCSYGQPYGLFQGGESNLRQFEYGHRAVRKLLGVRPQAFWEEEFWFFPQLPQILAGFGYTGACLFFQWTWHTPELPSEDCQLIRWRGHDGTELPTLPRNGLNLHQWPEDFDPMLASPLLDSLAKPALVQWIELMPSPDWMCRAEVLLPRMKELAADSRFELRPRTLSKLIAELDSTDAPVRAYSMDEVWHGLSLGKNANNHPRASARCERETLEAESIATMTAMLGRPYPSWDVYPHWEIEEAWREQLAAQHHDNHECEGLCGFIGFDQFERAERMSRRIADRSISRISHALATDGPPLLAVNPLPWTRDIELPMKTEDGRCQVMRDVPGCGYRRGDAEVVEPPIPCLPGPRELQLSVGLDGERQLLSRTRWNTGKGLPTCEDLPRPAALEPVEMRSEWRAHPIHPALELRLQVNLGEVDWDPGFAGALCLDLHFDDACTLLHDHPFAQSELRAETTRPRKYPSGDWMTSEQWFEEVTGPFTSQRFLQVSHAERSLLIVHEEGTQSWQRLDAQTLRLVLNLNDPWDEDYREPFRDLTLWFLDSAQWTAAQRHQVAEELQTLDHVVEMDCKGPAPVGGGDPALGAELPADFSALQVDGPIVATAFRRIGPHEGEGLPDWVATEMTAPHLVRLVELEGQPATGTLRCALPITETVRTNMLAEAVDDARAPEIVDPHTVRVHLRPHEIQTVVLDLPAAAKQARDLDARRKVWAQIHRTETS